MRFVLDSAGCFHWEDTEDGFKYIIQIHECAKKNRSKIKVKKWIDTPDLRQYEKFVWDWHQFLLDVQEVFYQTEDADLIKNLNMYVLSRFYTKSIIKSTMRKKISTNSFMNVLKKQKNF